MQVGHKPDFGDPVILSFDRGGTIVKSFVNQISSHLLKEFKYALVWGTSSKHMPQRCGKAHRLEDEGAPSQLFCHAVRRVRDAATFAVTGRPRADVVQIVKAKIKHGDEGRGRFSTVKKDNKDKKPLKS